MPATSWPPACSSAPPEVGDLSPESQATQELYGVNDPNKLKAGFARNCLLARRLIERGVRFVQLFNGAYAMGEGVGNWDGHKTLKAQYAVHAPILDQPCAALLKDLKARGLLDDTLVVWVTEFGRMPTFQKGASGRDHNPKGFTVWLAGAGVKRGFSYGATDEFGYQAVENVDHDLRSPRHDPAPARSRPRAAELLPQRHRAPPDRCAWPGHSRDSGLSSRDLEGRPCGGARVAVARSGYGCRFFHRASAWAASRLGHGDSWLCPGERDLPRREAMHRSTPDSRRVDVTLSSSDEERVGVRSRLSWVPALRQQNSQPLPCLAT